MVALIFDMTSQNKTEAFLKIQIISDDEILAIPLRVFSNWNPHIACCILLSLQHIPPQKEGT